MARTGHTVTLSPIHKLCIIVDILDHLGEYFLFLGHLSSLNPKRPFSMPRERAYQ